MTRGTAVSSEYVQPAASAARTPGWAVVRRRRIHTALVVVLFAAVNPACEPLR